MLFKSKYKGSHRDRDRIANALYQALTPNLHLGCSPAQPPELPQGSCIRRGDKHPSRPDDDLCVQLPPVMGVKQRESQWGHEHPGDKPPTCPPASETGKAHGRRTIRHQLLQPARRRQLRQFAGCWQGNFLERMANVRVTYRNSHTEFYFVCQHVHAHGKEGGVGIQQTGSQTSAIPPRCANRGWKHAAEQLLRHTLSW